MTRTRQSWEDWPTACELFHSLALALDQSAEAAHEPIEVRRWMADFGRIACIYREIDQANLRGPLKWRSPNRRFAGLPRLLTPLIMADYFRRRSALRKGPVAFQPIADEIDVLQAQPLALSVARQVPVTTVATVSGDVIDDGTVRIVGAVNGNIRCRSLDVGVGAYVHDTIVADIVTVPSRVCGTIYAGHLTLGAGCHVEADLFHGALVVEGETYFEGKSRRYADPVGLVPAGWPLASADVVHGDSQKIAQVLPIESNRAHGLPRIAT